MKAPGEKPSFLPCRELGALDQLAAADLIIESLPELYLATGIQRTDLSKLVADQFHDDGTELFAAYAILCEDGVGGAFAAYPAQQGRQLQEGSTFRLISEVQPKRRPDFEHWLFQHRTRIPPIPADSFYLARFAAAPRCRGTGFAGDLLQKFVSLNPGRAICSLHVSHTNYRAVAFYRRHGFVVFAAYPDGYSSMCLRLDPSGMGPDIPESRSQ
jgi:ribosomal protein S18 acetylase RimI-like enzyme